MNYRHAFHAGNFADVVKHALLCRLVAYLKRKDKPFRLFDTHAGRGLYDLGSPEAGRTGESADGIARLQASPAWDAPLLRPYREAVESVRERHGPASYPGSPLLMRTLLRREDRLSAYELHPEDAAALKATFAGDHQVKAIALDGWLALGAHLPPKERRGLVLVDPPFEASDEIDRILEGVAAAHRRWPGGIYALWYPIKRAASVQRLHAGLAASGIPRIVAADFRLEPTASPERLVGSGLAVVNAPHTFAAEAESLMRTLLPALGARSTGDCGIVALAGE